METKDDNPFLYSEGDAAYTTNNISPYVFANVGREYLRIFENKEGQLDIEVFGDQTEAFQFFVDWVRKHLNT